MIHKLGGGLWPSEAFSLAFLTFRVREHSENQRNLVYGCAPPTGIPLILTKCADCLVGSSEFILFRWSEF